MGKHSAFEGPMSNKHYHDAPSISLATVLGANLHTEQMSALQSNLTVTVPNYFLFD